MQIFMVLFSMNLNLEISYPKLRCSLPHSCSRCAICWTHAFFNIISVKVNAKDSVRILTLLSLSTSITVNIPAFSHLQRLCLRSLFTQVFSVFYYGEVVSLRELPLTNELLLCGSNSRVDAPWTL